MKWWLRWLGYLLGALSLFSLFQQLLNFKLTAIAAALLAFYRVLFYPPAAVISAILPFSIPRDIIVIYTLIGLALFRTALLFRQRNDVTTSKRDMVIVALTAAAWPVFFTGLWDLKSAMNQELARIWLFEGAKVVAAFLVLFALNAGVS